MTTRGFRFDLRSTTIAACICLTLAGSALAQAPDESLQDLSPAVLAQIAALQEEKASRTPAEQKISSRLLYAIKQQRGEMPAGISLRVPSLSADTGGRIEVDVTARPGTNLQAVLAPRNASVMSVTTEQGSGAVVARARLDANGIMALANRADVTSVRLPGQARVQSVDRAAAAVEGTWGQGARVTEGLVTHRFNAARVAFGLDGTGVKIGVLSGGVTHLADSQAGGELGPVTVLPGQAGPVGDEGTALLEILHDLVPGAQLYYATGFSGAVSFAQNIRALRTAGCDIILDAVGYLSESPFHDGQPAASTSTLAVITQAVNDVTADGAIYFSMVGNYGSLDANTSAVWEGDFVDGGTAAFPPFPFGRVHNFGGGNITNVVTTTSSVVDLFWADPIGASANDYDLYILNVAGTAVVDSSTDTQNGNDDPWEETGRAFQNERVLVLRDTGSPRFLHVNMNDGALTLRTAGQFRGHALAADAYAVASTPAAASFNGASASGPFPGMFTAANTTESNSSDGPRRVFYQANGLPFTVGNYTSTGGVLRQKPDITAADGVQHSGKGGMPSPLYGGTASVPHAAAVAALLKQARPTATPAEIRTWLTSTALDIGAPGIDRNSGYGIVMPVPALVAAGMTGGVAFDIASYVLQENPGNGDAVVFAGEGARLTVTLSNIGLAAASAISATLTTTTPGVTITQPAARVFPNAAVSATTTNAIPFTFTLPSDAASGLTVNFTLTVSYAESATPQVLNFAVATGACPACTRNHVPTAVVHNVTVTAGSNGTAVASIDNGSSDADGDPLTIVASPAGPYAIGVTNVLLTVTDDKGATSQAMATVTVQAQPPTPPPTVTSIAPAQGITAGGTRVTILGTGFSTTAGGTTVMFGATAGTNVVCASTTQCAVTSPAGTGVVSVRVTVDAGTSADTAADDFTFTTMRVYLLGEGATGAFFDEDVLLANANTVDVPVTIRFLTEGGVTVPVTRTLAAQSRVTVHVDTIPGLENTAVAAEITSENGLPLAVERSMFWDASYYAGHAGPAQSAPATDWYFAEGSQGFFDTYVLVINPNASATDVTFTFLREGDTPVTKTVTVDPRSRYTLGTGTIPDLIDRSFSIVVSAVQPVTTDRAMYFGTTAGQLWGGGTASSGSVLSPKWYFAEGATGSFFDTFLLLGNPSALDAHVTITYLLDTGETVTTSETVAAKSRLTINPEAGADVRLKNAAFATTIASDVNIVAERSMYWPGKATPWGEAHNITGFVAPGVTWDLAEGRDGGVHDFHTYILLANPQTTDAAVTVTYLREDGSPVAKDYVVAASSRLTIDTRDVPELIGGAFGARVAVTNSMPILVERSMYWSANGVFFAGGSNGGGILVP